MTVEVHHVVEGPEGAPVVLFASSLGTTHAMWDDQAAALRGEYRVVRYDHRGHGGSPVPPGPYSIADLADDVLALLDRLELERVAFVGLSIGGAVAMTAALRAPERIERLVLCSTAPNFGPPEQWIERAKTVRAEGVEAVAPAALERWLTPEAPAGSARAPRDHAARHSARGLRRLRRGARRLRPARPARAHHDAGAGDRGRRRPAAPPAALQAIVDEVPHGRLHVIERRGTSPTSSGPRSSARLLRETPGMRTRRAVLGDAHVDRRDRGTTGFTADFQDLITRYAWGEIWTRPGLDRKTRSALTLTALVAGGRETSSPCTCAPRSATT